MIARVLLGVAFLSTSLVASAQVNRPLNGGPKRFRGDVPMMLVRAIQAQPRLRYTGTYTVEFKQGPTPLRHVEYITRDAGRYRIDFPSNSQFAGQVIIEDQNIRQHYRPNVNEIIQQPPRHGEAWEKVANLATDPHYQLTTAPGSNIAGFKTDQLVVMDKSGNVLQRLFIEPNSGVIMKRQIFDAVGTPAGYFEFTSIDLDPKIDPSIFVIKRKNAKIITPIMQLQRLCTRRGFNLRYLPPGSGFQLEGANPRNFAGIEGLVQTYLNGKARLWIYQLKAPLDPERLRQQAGKNQQFFSFQSLGETIVLIGNVPERKLERFATQMTGGTQTPGSKL